MQSTSELDVLLKILSAPEGYATKNIQHRQAVFAVVGLTKRKTPVRDFCFQLSARSCKNGFHASWLCVHANWSKRHLLQSQTLSEGVKTGFGA